MIPRPWKQKWSLQKWSLHLHPFCCLYTCECSTLLLSLLPELGNTHAQVVFCTINFDGLAICPFRWEAEMVPQLVKEYTRSQPIPSKPWRHTNGLQVVCLACINWLNCTSICIVYFLALDLCSQTSYHPDLCAQNARDRWTFRGDRWIYENKPSFGSLGVVSYGTEL